MANTDDYWHSLQPEVVSFGQMVAKMANTEPAVYWDGKGELRSFPRCLGDVYDEPVQELIYPIEEDEHGHVKTRPVTRRWYRMGTGDGKQP